MRRHYSAYGRRKPFLIAWKFWSQKLFSWQFLKRWAIPGLFFFKFVFSIVKLVDIILPMSGFKPWIFDVGSAGSTN